MKIYDAPSFTFVLLCNVTEMYFVFLLLYLLEMLLHGTVTFNYKHCWRISLSSIKYIAATETEYSCNVWNLFTCIYTFRYRNLNLSINFEFHEICNFIIQCICTRYLSSDREISFISYIYLRFD